MSRKSIEMMMEYETALAELYRLFSSFFKELSAFWKQLSDEEIKHSILIHELLQKVDNKSLYLNEERFKERPLETSLDYVREVTERAQKGELNLINALSIANSIESSVIEAKYLEIFEGESIAISKLLNQLLEETRNHQKRIAGMLEKKRKNI